MKQLICGSLNGMSIRQPLLEPYIPWTGPLVPQKAQSWELEFKEWSNPRARAAVVCGEMDQGDVREKTTVGIASGGKPGSHGRKAMLLSHTWGWSHHHSLSLPTGQHWQLKSRQAGPSNVMHELQSRIPCTEPLEVPDPLIYRVGPQPGWPLDVPDALNSREGPQAREPSKYLHRQFRRKTGQRGLLIARYKRLKKRLL